MFISGTPASEDAVDRLQAVLVCVDITGQGWPTSLLPSDFPEGPEVSSRMVLLQDRLRVHGSH